MKDDEKRELTILTERIILGQEFRIYGTVENPLFLVADIARAIDHSNPSRLTNIVDEQNKLLLTLTSVHGQNSQGGLRENKECWFVTEAGLYKILMRSDKPKAQPFQDKVCEILKEIRQTGGYIHTEPDDDDDMIIARALIAAQRKIEMRDKQLAAKEAEIKELSPKAEYCDAVLTSYSGVTTTVIAQDYGMSAQKFNKLLMKMHIQYKQGNTWVLYREHKGKGYTESETIVKNGYSVVSTRWTQKGRQFIYETLKETGILPVKENKEAV